MVGMGSMSNNAADFSRSLMDLAHYAEKNIEQVIRKACIDLYRSIVEKTPVDTGRAKASWGISTTGAAAPQTNETGYSQSELVGIIDGYVSDFKLTVNDSTVTIVNNLEYMEYLEDGTSQQAPYGMVALSLAEFEAYFNHRLKGLEGFSPA